MFKEKGDLATNLSEENGSVLKSSSRKILHGGRFRDQGSDKRKNSANTKSKLGLKGRNNLDQKKTNENIIRCSICRKVLGSGKIKTIVICIFCYKRKGELLIGSNSLELLDQFKKLPEQDDLPKFLNI